MACFNLWSHVHEHRSAPLYPTCKRWKIMMMALPPIPFIPGRSIFSLLWKVSHYYVPSLFLSTLIQVLKRWDICVCVSVMVCVRGVAAHDNSIVECITYSGELLHLMRWAFRSPQRPQSAVMVCLYLSLCVSADIHLATMSITYSFCICLCPSHMKKQESSSGVSERLCMEVCHSSSLLKLACDQWNTAPRGP